jgi:SAM-dependent methyltransferase
MLSIARNKAQSAGLDIEFAAGDIRTIDLGRRFDAVISMFSVVCYQITNADLAAVCSTARRHLDAAGVFIFDGWYGPAVLAAPPAQRVKVAQDGNRRVVRFTQPTLDVASHTADIHFKVWITEGERILSEVDEAHKIRFLFPQEMAYFLQVAGFEQMGCCPFMDIEGSLDTSCWNFTAFARTCGEQDDDLAA